MRFLKKLFGILAVVVIVLVAVAYLLPREVAVSRSIQIAAGPDTVFPHVNSLHKFSEWSPWSSIDPEMRVTYSGPETGVGNKMDWTSEHPNVGNGSQIITASTQNESVKTALDFGPMGTADAEFVLAQKDGGTEVTWGFTGENTFVQQAMFRLMSMDLDAMVGADYEAGLANLKAMAEKAHMEAEAAKAAAEAAEAEEMEEAILE